ncbi:MAG TPA: alpha/beta hydrolase [Actinomycetes bacterium]|jgi:pimeloyl-ACP methyl ester carboxylesterase|nr:alpha/beta hydrolase [Actinomycetes bacterium]
MRHVLSKDGTRIAYERSGMGPPLVLIHGTGIDHTYWTPLIPELEQYFTVYTVDRRGRGRSGDTQPYAIRREFDDVAAVVDSIPGTVGLLGHSYGALCSLEAALRTTHVRKLALYEPPVYTTVEVSYPADIRGRFDALLKAGKAEEALLMVYEIGETSTDEVSLLRSLPSWQARVLAAHTIPREQSSVKSYSFDPSRFRNLKTPTLFLLGSESSPFYKAATEALHASLPHSRIAILPEQRHEAVVTAPELFLREVIGFFLGNGGVPLPVEKRADAGSH